ncbi:flagellar assembly protein FliH [Virgibacillus sp. NKC19-16]|uniref:flagellar assembly protein FliH n=1 Tax=Virgibacillus salidurans TaxID=2831673 RepID=UPI001F2DCF13|nr:flagellar assembly protein FliH [Virgibacillus sp. NKC19-16]UJL47936.1 flagellar assembly protein FliH [Virgibacillus sp. NKC19-16]
MSSHLNEHRVIEIKPIQFSKKTRDECLKQENNLQDEINKAKDQLQSLYDQKELLLHETKVQIEKEKRDWEDEKQQYIERSKEEGYKAGFLQGEEASLAKYQHIVDKANTMTDEAIRDYHSTIDKSEEAILDLAIHIAENIMKQKLTDEPNSFLSIVKAAIKELKDQSVISIYLHPTNYEYVLKQKDELVIILENEIKLAIYVNEDIQENGCLIKYPYGQIDAGIDTQLKQIRNVLHEITTETK